MRHLHVHVAPTRRRARDAASEQAYKGYTIKEQEGSFYVSKGGRSVYTAKSLGMAKQEIDDLVAGKAQDALSNSELPRLASNEKRIDARQAGAQGIFVTSRQFGVPSAGTYSDYYGRGGDKQYGKVLRASSSSVTFLNSATKKEETFRVVVQDADGVRVVYNKLLGGWYVVRGPHQTPLNGRFGSKEEAQAWLAARQNARDASEYPQWRAEVMKKYPEAEFKSNTLNHGPMRAWAVVAGKKIAEWDGSKGSVA